MFNKVSPGSNSPDIVNVINEIPAHSHPVKYEVDKDTGLLTVDRFMATSMRYPCDYGYIPETLAEDGDPVDVLIISPFPIISGAIIEVRPIGVLNMTDESGKDCKILAVPTDRISPLYSEIREVDDLFPLTLQRIEHFFKHYKDLETNKWVRIDGWNNAEAAKKEIALGIQNYTKDK